MAHFAKYAASSTGHLAAHYERRMNDKGEYIRFGNQDIDTSKSHLNYNLAPKRERGQLEFIQQRLSEVKVQKRADVNVMCSWVVTLPKEDNYSAEQEREFFEESYQFLSDKYGKQNVISAYVHMDEKQPHIHFSFIPVVPDRKWNEKHPETPREKVSAKECVPKLQLVTFHTDLQKRLDERFGENSFPVLNGATEGGNRTVQELKYKEVAIKCQQIEERYEETRQNLSEALYELTAAKKEKDAIWTDNAALRSDNARLKEENSNLTELISESKEELHTVEHVIAQKINEGAAVFDNMQSMKERIAAARKESEKSNRLRLLERFIELPQIKPLWEKFVQLMSRGRNTNRNKDDRSR